MTEAINAHKKMAMGMTEGNVMKKGGKVQKFAKGGIAESKVANLPALGDKRNAGVNMNAGKTKIATMKRGGMSKKPGIMIAIAVPKKGSSRGR
tara:strand:- start:172 stop:450 length:279 start_codon:yes stop_codon:yes gene_type:complete